MGALCVFSALVTTTKSFAGGARCWLKLIFLRSPLCAEVSPRGLPIQTRAGAIVERSVDVHPDANIGNACISGLPLLRNLCEADLYQQGFKPS